MAAARIEWSLSLRLTEPEARQLLDALVWHHGHAPNDQALSVLPIVETLQRTLAELSQGAPKA